MTRGSRGPYPFDQGKHLLVAIDKWVYADESGIQKSAPYCLVAGYIGSPKQWKNSKADWETSLQRFGVPEFHARDFFQPNRRRRLSHYRGWSRKTALKFIESLCEAIDGHALDAVCGAVNVRAFNAQPYPIRRFLTGGDFASNGKWLAQGAPTRPYRLAVSFLIRDATEHAKDGSRVHFVFERQNVFEGGTLQEFDSMKRSGFGPGHLIDTTKLGSLVFSDRRTNVELQAADLYTHCWYNELAKNETSFTAERAAAMGILSRKRPLIYVYEAANFEQFMNECRTVGIDVDLLLKMGPKGLERPV